jgi:hypothetical protein
MKKIYGEIGGVGIQYGGSMPNGYVEMSRGRPEGDYIGAVVDGIGQWIPGLTVAQQKMRGIEFQGVMCSATSDDQDGLTAIYILVKLNGGSSDFYFANGNVLNLNPSNFDAFYTVWAAFRQSFFQ